MTSRRWESLRNMATPDVWHEIELRLESPSTSATGPRRAGLQRKVVAGLTTLMLAALGLGLAPRALPRGSEASTGPIAPSSSRLGSEIARVHVGSPTNAIAVGLGAVWVVSSDKNTVYRIDPGANRIVASIPVGRYPWALAVGGESVWVANGGDGTVSKIDPRSNHVTDDIPVGGDPRAIAYGEGAVWVADYSGTLTRINPVTDTVKAVIDTGATELAALTVGEGSVWVASWGDGDLIRLDTQTNQVIGHPIVVGGRPDVTVSQGSVWATSTAYGTVIQIDSSTGNVLSHHSIGEGGPAPIQFSVTTGDDYIWVTGGLRPAILKLDPSTGKIVEKGPLEESAVDAAVGLGAIWLATTSESITKAQE